MIIIKYCNKCYVNYVVSLPSKYLTVCMFTSPPEGGAREWLLGYLMPAPPLFPFGTLLGRTGLLGNPCPVEQQIDAEVVME